VTDGSLLRGVRASGEGTRTLSVVMQTEPRRVRFIETLHVQTASEAGGVALRL
jgi:fructose-1,6-bisphosphatase/sedoheptulose 1,7-bisphosphatase-like protein